MMASALSVVERRAEFVVVLDFLRLCDGWSEFQGPLFDRRCAQLHAAPTRPVRLGHDQAYLEAGFHQFLQRGHCEARRSAENEMEGGGHSEIWYLSNFVFSEIYELWH